MPTFSINVFLLKFIDCNFRCVTLFFSRAFLFISRTMIKKELLVLTHLYTQSTSIQYSPLTLYDSKMAIFNFDFGFRVIRVGVCLHFSFFRVGLGYYIMNCHLLDKISEKDLRCKSHYRSVCVCVF